MINKKNHDDYEETEDIDDAVIDEELLEESVDEVSDDEEMCLRVVPYTEQDRTYIQNWLEESTYYAEENAKGFIFRESKDMINGLEMDIESEFDKIGIMAKFKIIKE